MQADEVGVRPRAWLRTLTRHDYVQSTEPGEMIRQSAPHNPLPDDCRAGAVRERRVRARHDFASQPCAAFYIWMLPYDWGERAGETAVLWGDEGDRGLGRGARVGQAL